MNLLNTSKTPKTVTNISLWWGKWYWMGTRMAQLKRRMTSSTTAKV